MPRKSKIFSQWRILLNFSIHCHIERSEISVFFVVPQILRLKAQNDNQLMSKQWIASLCSQWQKMLNFKKWPSYWGEAEVSVLFVLPQILRLKAQNDRLCHCEGFTRGSPETRYSTDEWLNTGLLYFADALFARTGNEELSWLPEVAPIFW